jgi:tetratricopeptide (TPR) repeat protein
MKFLRKPMGLAVSLGALALLAGCGPKRKEVSDRERKEAAHLASEAQFALSLKDYARTESLLAKAVELTPDAAPLWISLGSARVRQGKKDTAKIAYLGALKAYELEIAEKPEHAESWLKKVYVLALLGRTDEARGFLEKTAKKFPDTRNVKQFVDAKQFDRMLADPIFKDIAL